MAAYELLLLMNTSGTLDQNKHRHLMPAQEQLQQQQRPQQLPPHPSKMPQSQQRHCLAPQLLLLTLQEQQQPLGQELQQRRQSGTMIPLAQLWKRRRA